MSGHGSVGCGEAGLFRSAWGGRARVGSARQVRSVRSGVSMVRLGRCGLVSGGEARRVGVWVGNAGRVSQGMQRNGTSRRGQVRLGRYVGSR